MFTYSLTCSYTCAHSLEQTTSLPQLLLVKRFVLMQLHRRVRHSTERHSRAQSTCPLIARPACRRAPRPVQPVCYAPSYVTAPEKTEEVALLPLPRNLENPADDVTLANPLQRMERLSTGWFGVIMVSPGWPRGLSPWPDTCFREKHSENLSFMCSLLTFWRPLTFCRSMRASSSRTTTRPCGSPGSRQPTSLGTVVHWDSFAAG